MATQNYSLDMTAVVQKVMTFVKGYMSHYDGSHDWSHIQRVLALAKRITAASSPGLYNEHIVTLAALLHDVGDRKYLRPGEDAATLVQELLISFGVPAATAWRVQAIVTNVSYSHEVKSPQLVREALQQWPELAVVQDADRLDAIGAIGIGRTFTYGGAADARSRTKAAYENGVSRATEGKEGRGMAETIDHFHEKLLKLESMMKTDAGKVMARQRTQRLLTFIEWWEDEADVVQDLPASPS